MEPSSGGATLPVGWTSIPWATGGASTVAQGVVTVDGARAQTDALFGPGASLEFVATFGTAGFQHVGFGVTLDAAPWAIFSTRDGGALYARTNTGATSTDTPIAGNWLSAPHRYRIDWSTSSVSFFIDGTLVATHAVTIADTMRPIASDATRRGRDGLGRLDPLDAVCRLGHVHVANSRRRFVGDLEHCQLDGADTNRYKHRTQCAVR